MSKAKVYGAWVNGVWTEVKAYKKTNALSHLQAQDASVKSVSLTSACNSHQAPIDEK